MHNVQIYKWDIIRISESHLLTYTPSSYVDLSGYVLYRNDAHGWIARHGACCYVKSDILVGHVTAPIPNVLTIYLVSLNICVIIVYRAPSNSSEANTTLAKFVADFSIGKEIIVLGDFNLPNLDWVRYDLLIQGTPMEEMFVEILSSLGLTQWVKEPTCLWSGNALDLILTSEIDRVCQVQVLDPLPGGDQFPNMFECIFSGQSHFSNISQEPHRAWHRGNYELRSKRLLEIDWDLELAYLSANQSFDMLSAILSQLVNMLVPQKPSQKQELRLHWATRPPRSLIEHHQKAWNDFKAVRQHLGRCSSEAVSALSGFSKLNKQFRNFSVQSLGSYESRLLHDSKGKPKLIHSHIRRKKMGCPTIGPLKFGADFLTE